MNLPKLGRYKTIVVSITLFVAFIMGVLTLNFFSADRFSRDSKLVGLVEQQAAYLQWLDESSGDGSSTTAVADRFTQSLATFASAYSNKGQVQAEMSSALQTLQTAWAKYRKLDSTQTSDSASALSTVSASVAALQAEIDKQLANGARTLRMLQGIGIACSLLLLAMIVFHFLKNLRAEEAYFEQARRETEEILNTVNEGLFLLGRDMTIGTSTSSALNTIFRRETFEDLSFSDLLRSIVPEKTLAVAVDFVDLLWGDRVNENLIKDLNPLNEVEVHFQDGTGNFDTLYLAFDFNRVTVDGELSHILVTVVDITERVQLSRELEESQAQSQAQLDLLLSILHVEPPLLKSFLRDTEASMDLVNTVLKKPARDDAAFRDKLEQIFRQVHSIKGEAGALGLSTVEVKAHSFEDSLQALRDNDKLDGNDFLPLAVKLDDLLSHMASVRDLIERLSDLQGAIDETTLGIPSPPKAQAQGEASQVSMHEAKAPVRESFAEVFAQLADRIARERDKSIDFKSAGLEEVPEDYKKLIKDVSVQFIRNSIVHGIESVEERAENEKAPVGTMRLQFSRKQDGGFQLDYKDDGRGLVADDIRVAAIQKGVLSAEDAATMDDNAIMALIFKPGFSTKDGVDKDAGRGVGMDIVKSQVREHGGKLRVSTKAGSHTQFRILLPKVAAKAAA